MKDRLIQFLNHENLTASGLADRIGVQRSSVSHIISGRNKPSFDFIQKMINTFPNLNAQWLISGKGSIYSNTPIQESLFSNLDEKNISALESNIQNKSNDSITKKDSTASNVNEKVFESIENKQSKSIERIVIFFKDGTFNEYNPS